MATFTSYLQNGKEEKKHSYVYDPLIRLGIAKDPDERWAQIEERKRKLLEADSPAKRVRWWLRKANGECYTTRSFLLIMPICVQGSLPAWV